MNRPRLYLVPSAPLASFEEKGRLQASEAAERLVAVEILARFDKSPEVKEALACARLGMVVHRLLREDCKAIEGEAIAAVTGFFLGS